MDELKFRMQWGINTHLKDITCLVLASLLWGLWGFSLMFFGLIAINVFSYYFGEYLFKKLVS